MAMPRHFRPAPDFCPNRYTSGRAEPHLSYTIIQDTGAMFGQKKRRQFGAVNEGVLQKYGTSQEECINESNLAVG